MRYFVYFGAVSDKSDFIDQLCKLCFWWPIQILRVYMFTKSFDINFRYVNLLHVNLCKDWMGLSLNK